ncbi:MAG: Npt1/Npt2 family nucleotide transporter [Pseudomonadota bacterium]|nr:Npt1/Npt2 family nucleotide transporter [Pseudomonadota bacterium]
MLTITFIRKNKRALIMALLITFTVLGYNVMRGMKKAVILTLPSAGAAYIPFVKTMLVMPMSILIGAFYLYIRHKRGIIHAYYTVTLSFLVYFILFTFTLLPNLTMITPNSEWIAAQQLAYPHFKFFIGLLSIWPIAFYYVAAELWGTYSLVVLFWQVANELFTPSEATETYPIFIFVSSFSVILASFVLQLLSMAGDPLTACTICISSIGVCMMLLVFYLNTQYSFENNINHAPTSTSSSEGAEKKKPSLLESFQLTLQSPHVFYIGVCVFSFGMLVNFFELSLDHKVAVYYSSPKLLLEFQSWFTRTKGILFIIANLVNAILLRRIGWFGVALITPGICILSANLFLFSCYHIDFINLMLKTSSSEELVMWAGCVLLVITYACKYSFFDTTKELAFTPLPNSIKASAKAVADGICGRAGKSGSSFVQASLMSITAAQTVPDIIPYLMYLGATLSIFWIWSMLKLNKSYQEKMRAFASENSNQDNAATTDEKKPQQQNHLEPSTITLN